MCNYLNIIDKELCTGCGTCAIVCPFNAINMVEDEYGFIYPELDKKLCKNCGLCKKKCHILNAKFNKKQKKCYAVMANDDIRMESSSGGIFTVVANYILDNNGYVCGAAFDENWNVIHKIVNNKEELKSLQKSKYVQSDLKNTFPEIEKLLKDNKQVLFVGTPCQVASLNTYLDKKIYKNLITMDLVCHGTPNNKTWHKFLRDNIDEEITNIKFRDKQENGWDPYLGTINTSVYTKNDLKVFKTYMQAYCSSMSTRDACPNCKYTKVERVSDITVCDFWYISKYYEGLDDKKGTSFLMMNTTKGKEVLKNLRKRFKLFKRTKIDIYDYSYYNNHHMARNAIAHKHKPFFLNDLKNGKNFNDAVNRWVKQTHDVGLVGFYSGINYGTQLQYYSLYQTINDLGYSVLMINNPLNAPVYPRKKIEMFKKDPYRPIDRAGDFLNKEAMRRLNNSADRFIAGSDQYFRPSIYKRMGEYVALDWVMDSKPKYGYAISFATKTFEGDEYTRANMHYLLNKFDKISVREESGVEILKNEFNLEAQVCVDPVFLLDSKYLDYFINQSEIETKENYILTYILDRNAQKTEVINQIKDKMQMEIEAIEDPVPLFLNNKLSILIEDWLKYYKNAKFIITDSFHGVCMALIFKKQFVFFNNKLRGSSRFDTLKNLFKFGNREIESIEDFNLIYEKSIDYNIVSDIIAKEKQKSMNYLNYILTEQKKKPISDYDMLMNHKCNELSNEINKLRLLVNLSKHEQKYRFKYHLYRILCNLCKTKTLNNKKQKYKEKLDFIKGAK